MKKIYLICGFIGSGKTTFSKALAQKENAFRFSPDEWMIPLFGEHMERELFDSRLNTLMSLFKKSSEQLLEIDVPVIFDTGFWAKQERIEMRKWAESFNVECETIYLNTPFETCRSRALSRNDSSSEESFDMTDEMLDLFWGWFEEPAENENVTVVQN